MKALALCGAMFLALLSPVAAQDTPVCGNYFDEVVPMLQEKIAAGEEMTLIIVEGDKLPALVSAFNEAMGANVEGVTRAIVLVGVNTVVGFEIDGCLSDPILVTFPLPAKQSGRVPDGRTFS